MCTTMPSSTHVSIYSSMGSLIFWHLYICLSSSRDLCSSPSPGLLSRPLPVFRTTHPDHPSYMSSSPCALSVVAPFPHSPSEGGKEGEFPPILAISQKQCLARVDVFGRRRSHLCIPALHGLWLPPSSCCMLLPAPLEMFSICVSLFAFFPARGDEISFDPDDIISNIEMMHEEGWQRSVCRRLYGLFPANYVEMWQ